MYDKFNHVHYTVTMNMNILIEQEQTLILQNLFLLKITLIFENQRSREIINFFIIGIYDITP